MVWLKLPKIKSIDLLTRTDHIILCGSTSLALWKRIFSGVSFAFPNVWEVVFSCCDPEWFETVVCHDEQESCGQMDQGWGTGLLNAACGEWYPAATATGNYTFYLIAGKIGCYMLSAKFWTEVCKTIENTNDKYSYELYIIVYRSSRYCPVMRA